MTEERERILIVDDEESVRNVIRQIFEEAGYEVITAASGLEALEQLSRQDIGTALLDIKMPGMSGMELLGKLTADWPDICVVMVTCVADMETAIEAMKLGAYDYITKPFNLDDTVVTIRRAIERRDLQLKNKLLMLELQQSVKDQGELMQSQFNELVQSLSREHKLLCELAAKQLGSAQSLLSRLPPELREPISSFDEFKDALLRILGRL